ncbi:conserved hypothetical protein [Nitrosococcus halophilus Nc 4]|uniref:DUF4365 domain-containing protein n=1 Tax=Nitrosococcus halophilus (strain Nc4) TaxID=472759 RepID=D5BYD7_NITHN|nr:DUF4365 domain-containing protein [Nitrosococcus halophilus]ADE14120.1 conserved hypothetical protein [Nitrosococcus halophilus Nc 4]
MDLAQQKEQFSVAYIKAIAAQAGLNNAHPSVDDDSIDLELIGKDFKGILRNPKIELQLKCTSRDLLNGNVIKFPLSLKNYNDLRGDNVLCPRYLAVLVIPENVQDWVEYKDEELILRNSCYWVSIRNHPKTYNKTKVTVDIPLKQRLTKETLVELMTLASKGEYL